MLVVWGLIILFAFVWYRHNRQERERLDFEWDIDSTYASFDNDAPPRCNEGSSSESRNRRTRLRARERFWRGVRGTNIRLRQGAGKVRKLKSLFRATGGSRGGTSAAPEETTLSGDMLTERAVRLAASAHELGADGAEYVSALEALRAERDAAQEKWVSELDRVAKQLEELHGDVKTCVVDLEPIRPGERVVSLVCGHQFHVDCLLPYFATLENPVCPIDRIPVGKENVNSLPIWTVPERNSASASTSTQARTE